MKVQVNNADVFYGTGSGLLSPEKKTILFLHGAGFDHSVWVMPARHFARKGFNVVALDLPGHGRSPGPALTSIESMAALVADTLQALAPQIGTDSVDVVGHSMGTLICFALRNTRPEIVNRMALLGTSSPMAVGQVLLDAAEDNDSAAYSMANTWSHSASGQLGSAAVPGTHNLMSGQRWLERNSDDVYFSDLAACNAYDSGTSNANPAGDVETLIIAGTDDKMTPAKAGLGLAAGSANCQSVVLQGCGHSMLAERPNEVLDALIDFLN